MDYKRKDIIGINLNSNKGDEVGKIRPCVIISGDDENIILDTVIVMPLSTKLIDDMLPFRIRIEKQDGLLQNSDVLINHIRAISKKRITSFIGRIDDSAYNIIIDNLCSNFR